MFINDAKVYLAVNELLGKDEQHLAEDESDSSRLENRDFPLVDDSDNIASKTLLEKTAILFNSDVCQASLKYNFDLFKNLTLPYLNQQRFYGEGPVRIGTSL